ncbi:hypothetical protein LTR97_008848 [Elasticomyces elasticus]|uniref:Uncharacterized protein n=1 Tax=Elasticomyces elasticus TaxID=574655 RepID=A0AAN7ZZZ7_9PEZI|nr:hypothetical protein LTR97_008848 [Elasticomyces elasticus]
MPKDSSLKAMLCHPQPETGNMAQIPEAGMNDLLGVLNRIADNLSTLNESMSLLVAARQPSVQDLSRPLNGQEPGITPVPIPSANGKCEPETMPVPNNSAGPNFLGLGSWQRIVARGADGNVGGRVVGELRMEDDENMVDQMLDLLVEKMVEIPVEKVVDESREYSSARSWRLPGRGWN